MSSIQQALLMVGAAGGATDPSFASVVALFHFDGTNGDTGPYHDSSNNVSDLQRISTSVLTTTSPKFGTACLDVLGGNCVNAAQAPYGMAAGDFTVEFWLKTASPGSTYNLYDNTVTAQVEFGIYIAGGTFVFYANAGVTRITGGTVATSTWQNVSASRVSGTTRMFIDGTQVGSNYTDGNNYTANKLAIGISTGGSFALSGQIDEFRLTKGVGRYSSNYTPEAVAFPDS